jgi:hypothetical protein
MYRSSSTMRRAWARIWSRVFSSFFSAAAIRVASGIEPHIR